MEVYYCDKCDMWCDFEEIENVTPPPKYNAIEPPDTVLRCSCGAIYDDDLVTYNDSDVLDLLNEVIPHGYSK